MDEAHVHHRHAQQERGWLAHVAELLTACFVFSHACVCSTEKLPVEAKLPWYKQAQELEEGAVVSEEPS